jgi:hypothetical protein
MKMKITSILIGILLTTAAFLLAQALSPNRGAHLSASPGGSSSGDVATSAAETCDPQTVAKAAKGYACVMKTKSGPVAWRVEAVISTESRTFRVVKDQERSLRQRRHGEALARVSKEREFVPVARLFESKRQSDVRDLAAAIRISA